MHGSFPKGVDVFERLNGVIPSQVDAFVLMPKVKFASVAIISVRNPNDGATAVGQQEKQFLLDRFKVAAGDFVSACVAVELVNEKFVLADEFLG